MWMHAGFCRVVSCRIMWTDPHSTVYLRWRVTQNSSKRTWQSRREDSYSGGTVFKPRTIYSWFSSVLNTKRPVIRQVRPHLLPYTSRAVHYLLIILPFDCAQYELLAASLNRSVLYKAIWELPGTVPLQYHGRYSTIKLERVALDYALECFSTLSDRHVSKSHQKTNNGPLRSCGYYIYHKV
jgi:hypothetical protein